MIDRIKRHSMLVALAVFLLIIISIGCLIPLGFIADPTDDGKHRQEVLIYLALFVSFISGSSAVSLIVLYFSGANSYIQSRRSTTAVGLAFFIIFFIAMYSMAHKFIPTKYAALAILFLYIGGGHLMIAGKRWLSPVNGSA